MKFSVVIPSYLGKYTGAASNRDKKIIRAINSVLKQTFQDFEILITADGCKETVKIVKENYNRELQTKKIKLFEIPKQRIWSGRPRNTGIQNATGEWICYLDIDDLFSSTHLEKINEGIKKNPDMDWVYFHDLSYDKIATERNGHDTFTEHFIKIYVRGQCGTSNICHKRTMNARWILHGNSQHDFVFIQSLFKISKKCCIIDTPGYCICHVPGLLDV